jgi:hypothetical protein
MAKYWSGQKMADFDILHFCYTIVKNELPAIILVLDLLEILYANSWYRTIYLQYLW